MKINVNSVKFKVDTKLDAFIRDKVEKLASHDDSIISSDVILKLDSANTIDNKIVEIKVAIRGTDLFSKKQSNTFEEALDNATDALKKQLIKHK